METPSTQHRPFLKRLAADLGLALRHGRRRLARPGVSEQALWNRQLVLLVVLCLAAIPIAALFDAALLAYARDNRDGASTLMHALTDVGLSQWYLLASGATLAAVLAADWRARGLAERGRLSVLVGHAGFVFGSILGSGLLVNLVKVAAGRSRPVRFDEVGAYRLDMWSFGYANASFPSGHATTMGAVAAILCLWFPAFKTPILVACLFVALTRVFAQAHYLSDVVAGFSLGMVFVIVAARLLAARGLVFRAASDTLLPTVRSRHRLRLRRTR